MIEKAASTRIALQQAGVFAFIPVHLIHLCASLDPSQSDVKPFDDLWSWPASDPLTHEPIVVLYKVIVHELCSELFVFTSDLLHLVSFFL